MPAAMEVQRGKIFGCGMAAIALGDGVLGSLDRGETGVEGIVS